MKHPDKVLVFLPQYLQKRTRETNKKEKKRRKKPSSLSLTLTEEPKAKIKQERSVRNRAFIEMLKLGDFTLVGLTHPDRTKHTQTKMQTKCIPNVISPPLYLQFWIKLPDSTLLLNPSPFFLFDGLFVTCTMHPTPTVLFSLSSVISGLSYRSHF